MQFVHRVQDLLQVLLLVKDVKAPKEIEALLVFLGEMVTLVSQGNQVPLVLLAPLESVNHVLVVRTILPSMTLMTSRLEV